VVRVWKQDPKTAPLPVTVELESQVDSTVGTRQDAPLQSTTSMRSERRWRWPIVHGRPILSDTDRSTLASNPASIVAPVYCSTADPIAHCNRRSPAVCATKRHVPISNW